MGKIVQIILISVIVSSTANNNGTVGDLEVRKGADVPLCRGPQKFRELGGYKLNP